MLVICRFPAEHGKKQTHHADVQATIDLPASGKLRGVIQCQLQPEFIVTALAIWNRDGLESFSGVSAKYPPLNFHQSLRERAIQLLSSPNFRDGIRARTPSPFRKRCKHPPSLATSAGDGKAVRQRRKSHHLTEASRRIVFEDNRAAMESSQRCYAGYGLFTSERSMFGIRKC